MADRSPLYLIEVYGLGNPWLAWQIEHGGLQDLCRGCGGSGIIVTSPCEYRGVRCNRETGCKACRRKCGTCYGHGMPLAPVHAEDFGDQASRDLVERLPKDVAIDFRKRLDMNAPALGGGG